MRRRRSGVDAKGDASPYDPLYQMRMRQAEGPMCEHCAVWADEWEREYYVDHDSSSDLLRASEEQPWMCRTGAHPRHWPRYPGWSREGWGS